MNRRSGLYRSGLMSGLAALLAAIALFAAPSQAAHADSGCDCWIVTPSSTNPPTVGAGTSDVYSFTVTDNDPNETLETLTFTAPTTEFAITGATVPGGTTLSPLPASSVTLTLPSSVARSVGSSFTVVVTAVAPCTSSSGTWSLSDTDSLDINEAIWSSSRPSVSVTGQDSLAFTGEPASTTVNAAITAVGSQGGPVTVEVLNGCGQLDTASRAEVSVALAPGSGSGTLSGAVPVPASEGIASFSNLSINQPGGYTLIATSSGISSATSDGFTIYSSGQLCSSSMCSDSASSATTSGTVTTSSATAGDVITAGIGGSSYTCKGTYQPVSDAFSFGLFSATGVPQPTTLTGTLNINKSLVQSSGRLGASSWQICYASTSTFTALTGTSGTTTIGDVMYNTGLLPNCTSTQGPPCVQHRNKGNAGNVIVTFFAPGDPFGRG
jgi:hypothetical protein